MVYVFIARRVRETGTKKMRCRKVSTTTETHILEPGFIHVGHCFAFIGSAMKHFERNKKGRRFFFMFVCDFFAVVVSIRFPVRFLLWQNFAVFSRTEAYFGIPFDDDNIKNKQMNCRHYEQETNYNIRYEICIIERSASLRQTGSFIKQNQMQNKLL